MFEINEGICRPQALAQLFASDEFSGTNQESTKNLERLTLHLQKTAVAAQLSCAQVGFELSEADDLRIRSRLVRQHIQAICEQE
jgi:hypothetical protein